MIHETEEFAIYLNYVRKLGFEETPDYEFLRELFAKVLKNNGDIEDGVYDWNLLNSAYRDSIILVIITIVVIVVVVLAVFGTCEYFLGVRARAKTEPWCRRQVCGVRECIGENFLNSVLSQDEERRGSRLNAVRASAAARKVIRVCNFSAVS